MFSPHSLPWQCSMTKGSKVILSWGKNAVKVFLFNVQYLSASGNSMIYEIWRAYFLALICHSEAIKVLWRGFFIPETIMPSLLLEVWLDIQSYKLLCLTTDCPAQFFFFLFSSAEFMDVNWFISFYKTISAMKSTIRKQEFSLHLTKSFRHAVSAWKITVIVKWRIPLWFGVFLHHALIKAIQSLHLHCLACVRDRAHWLLQSAGNPSTLNIFVLYFQDVLKIPRTNQSPQI